MAGALIAAFYFYERWWRSGKTVYLGALTLVALLAFFNHYNGGAATMLALAAWHLIHRGRTTTPRQWLALAAGAMVVAALGTAYLAWVGVIGGERSGFQAFTGGTAMAEVRRPAPWFLLGVLQRIGIYTRDLFAADWISWPVFLWFAGMLLLPLARSRRGTPAARKARRNAGSKRPRRAAAGAREVAAERSPREARGAELPVKAVAGIVQMGALFALFSAALSVQPVWAFKVPFADLRYYMGALPLLLAMKGLFVEWTWRKSKLAGAAAVAVLLFSSAGAWPFNIRSLHTGEPTLGLHLAQVDHFSEKGGEIWWRYR